MPRLLVPVVSFSKPYFPISAHCSATECLNQNSIYFNLISQYAYIHQINVTTKFSMYMVIYKKGTVANMKSKGTNKIKNCEIHHFAHVVKHIPDFMKVFIKCLCVPILDYKPLNGKSSQHVNLKLNKACTKLLHR